MSPPGSRFMSRQSSRRGSRLSSVFLPVLPGRHIRKSAKRFGEVALVGKSGCQRNISETKFRGSQKRLSARDAEPPDILADRAAEAAMKLPADLDRVTFGAAGQLGEGQPAFALLMEHFLSSAQPCRNRRSPPHRFFLASQEKFERQRFNRQPRKLVVLLQLSTQKSAQYCCFRRGKFSWDARHGALLAGAFKDGVLQFQKKAAGP